MKLVLSEDQKKVMSITRWPASVEFNLKPSLTRDEHRKMVTRAEITYAFTGDWLLSLQTAERAYLEIISMGIIK